MRVPVKSALFPDGDTLFKDFFPFETEPENNKCRLFIGMLFEKKPEESGSFSY